MKNNNIITKIDEDTFKYKLDSIDDLIAVIDYVRPTAKDIFKTLGYEIKQGNESMSFEGNNFAIDFVLKEKRIDIRNGDYYTEITLDELTAINKQIEELGWQYGTKRISKRKFKLFVRKSNKRT